MNLTVVWNVWNNYEDVLLGSEILRLENKSKKLFDELFLYSQGGYDVPPSNEEKRYLDDYFNVEIDETHPLIKKHVKFKGVFRVLNGLKNAYKVGLENGSDFVVVTNGDAWILNVEKLQKLLNDDNINKSAISARIGPCNGMYVNYGDFVPFFDDHFMILNIKKCEEHKVFDYDVPKAYNANFLNYGGIHYILTAMMDELVPDGFFNIYTTLENCVNHYGERSGFALLPWQFDKELEFIHANCAQEPFLNRLRAYQLEILGFDKYPCIFEYCKKHNDRDNLGVDLKSKTVYFKKSFFENIKYLLVILNMKLKYFVLSNYLQKKELNYLNDSNESKYYFNLYKDILPIAYSSRSVGNKNK